MRTYRSICRPLVIALLAGAVALGAQEEPLPLTFVEEVKVEWVMIPVVVSSPGGYVEGLEVRDFRLLVDGRPTPIETFESDPKAPASLLLLQDLSGSMALAQRLERSRHALAVLASGLHQSDEVGLVSFAHARVRVDLPFGETSGTSGSERLEELAAEWSPEGVTGLYDAMTWLPEMALEGRRLRRAAVVITDGADNASELDPEWVTALLRRYELPVYVLDLSARRPDDDGENAEPSDETLEKMAAQTGGRRFEVASDEQVLEASRSILADLRRQYVLAFSTTSGIEPGPHTVEVELRRQGKKRTRHRAEYFGPPPSAWNAMREDSPPDASTRRNR